DTVADVVEKSRHETGGEPRGRECQDRKPLRRTVLEGARALPAAGDGRNDRDDPDAEREDPPSESADQEKHRREAAEKESGAPPGKAALASAREPEDQKQERERQLHEEAEQQDRGGVDMHARPRRAARVASSPGESPMGRKYT